MKKKLFLVLATMLFISMVATPAVSAQKRQNDTIPIEMPTSMEGTVWVFDAEIYHYYLESHHIGIHYKSDTIMYQRLRFLEDGIVLIEKMARSYRRNFNKFVVDCTACKYTYEAQTGTIKCFGKENECTFKVSPWKRFFTHKGDYDEYVTVLTVEGEGLGIDGRIYLGIKGLPERTINDKDWLIKLLKWDL